MVGTAPEAASREVNRKSRVGVVVSDKNDQTVIVAIERANRHRLYHKVIRRTKRYPVHDAENLATTGDLVRIEECRPISKTKRWRLVEVLTEREVAEIAPETIGETLVDEMQRSASRAAAEDESEGTSGDASPPVAAEEPAASAGEPVAEADSSAETAETGTTEAETAEPAETGDTQKDETETP